MRLLLRTCGECTACCKTHSVFAIAKEAGKWCEHCQIGKGCQIYNERPTACRDFRCVWLKGIGDPRHRPDKTGIVPDHRKIPGIGIVMWFFEVREGALESEFTRNWTKRNLMVGNCVLHVPTTGSPKLFLPKGKEIAGLDFRMESGESVEIVLFVSGRF